MAFLTVPGVEQVSGTSGLFGFFGGDGRFIKKERSGDSILAAYFSVTPSFIKNMELKLIAGENLRESSGASHFVLINEEASKILGFKNNLDAIGATISQNDNTQYIVTGVVKNFHYASMLRPIAPLLLTNKPDEFNTISLKVSKGAEQSIIPMLEGTWKSLYGNQPFKFEWFDKQLYDQHLHKEDLTFIGLLTVMALTIAFLGLLGMVIFTTKSRAKEVSIRRIMGAKVRQVMSEISREFVILLAVSVCIGLPIGYFTGKKFLQQYAYQVPVNFTILAGCASSLLLLGIITIGWQTYRTAISNPAKSLRTE
jgi:putative ABC transport system permease protein